jgi:HSP20 family molecular chaperone IbpA
MAKRELAARRVKDIEELSRHWSPEDLMRNLDEEMSRLEHGLGHMIYDHEYRRVSVWLRPLPVTPSFDLKETDSEVTLSVKLPNVSKENVHVNVEKNSVELFACSDDAICRPHYLSVESYSVLDPDSTDARMVGDIVEVKVLKVRKKKVKVN